MLSFGVLVEDLLGKFMYISQFRRYAQLSSGTRDILLDGSFEYPRQMFVKKPSYMSITHSHYLEV